MLEIIFIVLVIAGLGLWAFGRPKFTPPKTAKSDQRTYRQFEAAGSLFVNRAEMGFYHALRRELPEDFCLMSKVRLEDIICVKAGVKDAEARWKLRARVKSRHVDFLIIDDIGTPIVAIEVDGPSHQSAESFEADTLKNGLFKAAGIPLRRVLSSEDYHARAKAISVEILASRP